MPAVETGKGGKVMTRYSVFRVHADGREYALESHLSRDEALAWSRRLNELAEACGANVTYSVQPEDAEFSEAVGTVSLPPPDLFQGLGRESAATRREGQSVAPREDQRN